MSYILDALRKSEEARRRQQGPDLSLPPAVPIQGRERSSRAVPLLALALLLNGIVLGIWLLGSNGQAPVQTMKQSTSVAETRKPPTAVIPSASITAAPSPAPTATPSPDSNGSDWRQKPIQRIDDLAPSSRSRLPTLVISTHIYSAEPRFREVRINGRRYQEGDSVAGLALLEITETGILMSFEDQVIQLDLQDEWTL